MDRHSFVAASSRYDATDMPAGTRVRYYQPAAALSFAAQHAQRSQQVPHAV